MRLAALSLAPRCAAADKSTEGAWEAALQSARHHDIKSQADKEGGEKKIKDRRRSRIKLMQNGLNSSVFRQGFDCMFLASCSASVCCFYS